MRRWAVAEAKRASARLELAETEQLLAVAHRLGWELRIDGEMVAVPVVDYVRLATPIREGDFRLSRQRVASGHVQVAPSRAARLMEEGIRRTLSIPVVLDPAVHERPSADRGGVPHRGGPRMPPPQARRSLVGTSLRPEAFPPCIRKMRRTLQGGGEPLARRTLRARRVPPPHRRRTGHDRGQLPRAPDFDEGITRYQVEHITLRDEGSGYDPPECETLRAHGLCIREGDPTSNVPSRPAQRPALLRAVPEASAPVPTRSARGRRPGGARGSAR